MRGRVVHKNVTELLAKVQTAVKLLSRYCVTVIYRASDLGELLGQRVDIFPRSTLFGCKTPESTVDVIKVVKFNQRVDDERLGQVRTIGCRSQPAARMGRQPHGRAVQLSGRVICKICSLVYTKTSFLACIRRNFCADRTQKS